jgi:hypothetical protein
MLLRQLFTLAVEAQTRTVSKKQSGITNCYFHQSAATHSGANGLPCKEALVILWITIVPREFMRTLSGDYLFDPFPRDRLANLLGQDCRFW